MACHLEFAPKYFFVITGLIIVIGLHESIWHICLTRMTVKETIQVVNMWQAPHIPQGLQSFAWETFAWAKVSGDQIWRTDL